MKLLNKPEDTRYTKNEAIDKEGGSKIFMQSLNRTMLSITTFLSQKHNPQYAKDNWRKYCGSAARGESRGRVPWK
jgi:hypothetical protein